MLGFIFYLDVFPELDDMATWGVCDIPLWCFISYWNFMHVYCGLFEDVTSISELFIIIVWFIAYLEIGRYISGVGLFVHVWDVCSIPF